MKLIVAVDKNWGIGYKGDLLARVKKDLMNFKAVTLNKTVVYGSNTLATFPHSAPLKNRHNIILNPSRDFKVDGADIAHSLDELFIILNKFNTGDVYVIGGASVYRQLLPYCNEAVITKFDKLYESDVQIPDLDKSPEWECVSESETFISDAQTDSEPNLAFKFTVYKRVL